MQESHVGPLLADVKQLTPKPRRQGPSKIPRCPISAQRDRYWRHYWVMSSMLVFNARSPDHSRVNGSSWPQQAHMRFPPVALMAKVPPKRQHHHDVPAYTHIYALLTHCIALSHRTRPSSQPARASQATVVESRNVNPPRLDALEDRASPSYPNLTTPRYLPTYPTLSSANLTEPGKLPPSPS